MGITHATTVAAADDGTSEIGTNEWNAAHVATMPLTITNPNTGDVRIKQDRVFTDYSWVTFNSTGDFTGAAGIASGINDTDLYINTPSTSGEIHLTVAGIDKVTVSSTVVKISKLLSTDTTDGDVKFAIYNNTGTGIAASGADGSALAFYHNGAERGRVGASACSFGGGVGEIQMYLATTGYLRLLDGGSLDGRMSPNAAGIDLRNSTTAQKLHVYNTYTDGSNYERAVFDWTVAANVLTIGTMAAGTGSTRGIAFTLASIGSSNPAVAGQIYRTGNALQISTG